MKAKKITETIVLIFDAICYATSIFKFLNSKDMNTVQVINQNLGYIFLIIGMILTFVWIFMRQKSYISKVENDVTNVYTIIKTWQNLNIEQFDEFGKELKKQGIDVKKVKPSKNEIILLQRLSEYESDTTS